MGGHGFRAEAVYENPLQSSYRHRKARPDLRTDGKAEDLTMAFRSRRTGDFRSGEVLSYERFRFLRLISSGLAKVVFYGTVLVFRLLAKRASGARRSTPVNSWASVWER